MASGGLVEVINNKGCSKLFIVPPDSLTPSSSPISAPATTSGPFSGLVICVTGLSKEARKEVMEATERLGGQYSPSLHPGCTHLVVQSFEGRKFEHAVKHCLKNGLHAVTLGWFVDSVKRNTRLSEALYDARSLREIDLPPQESTQLPDRRPIFSNKIVHVDPNVSNDLKKKVIDAALSEGATCTDEWFVGCRASHVVCEGAHLQKYMGHASNLVTPLWILKSVRERHLQRLVHLSSDLARYVVVVLENSSSSLKKDGNEQISGQPSLISSNRIKSFEERQTTVERAKTGVRNRRSRHIQSYQTIIQPITPVNLLDSICWSVSAPASSASVYTDHLDKEARVASDPNTLDASFSNFSCPLSESDKSTVVLKTHFLTILFPLDRHGELGPCSRTFFSNGGFSCIQIINFIYNFYQVPAIGHEISLILEGYDFILGVQEEMSVEEMELAIHTDSEQAEMLRSVYVTKNLSGLLLAGYKRIQFLGTRQSFEKLKRVSGENYCSVYELVIRS